LVDVPDQDPSRLPAAAVPDSGIGAVLVSSRSLAEYRAMFALSDADLRRRLLDCPGGAASLTAEVNSAGGDAIACDPVYASLSAGQLDAQAETDRASRYVRAHLEQYRWSFFTDPDDHHRHRSAAGVRFATDRRAHPHRYLPGELPNLPFAGNTFDLVLSLDPQTSRETILGSWRSHNVILFGGWCVERPLVCPAFPLLRLVGPGRRSGRVRWWLVGLGR
jgi:hypothetical protein